MQATPGRPDYPSHRLGRFGTHQDGAMLSELWDWFCRNQVPRRPAAKRRHTVRPRLEALEGRYAPANLMVENPNNDGEGSLRDRVNDAADSGDTIYFNAGLLGATIQLQSSITTNKSLTIVGRAGPQGAILNISIHGGAGIRLFEFTGDGTNTINNLTLANGNAAFGAALYAGGSLVLNASTFRGNIATDGSGGAIHLVSSGTLSATDCTFESNESTRLGGAAYVFAGSVSLSGCTFSGNESDQRGGAIFVERGPGVVNPTFTATNCRFLGNTARDSGAVEVEVHNVVLTGCTFDNNQALNGNGGAVRATGPATAVTTLQVTDCTFTRNQALVPAGTYSTTLGWGAPSTRRTS
jgi:predicted outer membrane repeat protein